MGLMPTCHETCSLDSAYHRALHRRLRAITISLKTNLQKFAPRRERPRLPAAPLCYRMGMLFIGLAIGLAAGLLSGLLGIAGGVLMTPLLVILLHLDQKTAQGTSLAVLLPPTGLFAFLEYYRHGWANLHLGALMALGVTIGAYVGAHFVPYIPTDALRKAFAVFLVLVAVRVWLE